VINQSIPFSMALNNKVKIWIEISVHIEKYDRLNNYIIEISQIQPMLLENFGNQYYYQEDTQTFYCAGIKPHPHFCMPNKGFKNCHNSP
jgi:hypothetical protein